MVAEDMGIGLHDRLHLVHARHMMAIHGNQIIDVVLNIVKGVVVVVQAADIDESGDGTCSGIIACGTASVVLLGAFKHRSFTGLG